MPKIYYNNEPLCEVPAGTELQTIGPPLRFGCRQGGCGTCVIEVEAGQEHLSSPTKMEKTTLARLKASENCRLACQAAVKNGQEIKLSVMQPTDDN